MKVAFDYQVFATQRFGGISRYFFELAKNIPLVENSNCTVRVISPLYVCEYLKTGIQELPVLGMYMPQIPYTRKLVRGVNTALSPKMLKNFSPHIIHETYYSVNQSRPLNAKRVVTVYDMIHELFPEQFDYHDKTSEAKKHAISRADHVVCISNNTRSDLLRIHDVDPQKTSVVHLGFSLSGGNLKSSIGGRKPYLLYVGSRGGYKNFCRFIEAYGQSPMLKLNFDVVAFGGGGFTMCEKSIFQELRISGSKITQVSGDDALLESYYKDAALFVFPSLYEGFGIPPLEAMSYGCPVACSNTSSIPEVVGDAAVLFDPNSTESIMSSLEAVLLDSDFKEAMIKRGFDRIQRFSWRKCAEGTLGVYEQVLQ
ncbi:glycosyltransferase family 4 protein [Haliea sp.]